MFASNPLAFYSFDNKKAKIMTVPVFLKSRSLLIAVVILSVKKNLLDYFTMRLKDTSLHSVWQWLTAECWLQTAHHQCFSWYTHRIPYVYEIMSKTSTAVDIEKTYKIIIYRCRWVAKRIKIDFAAIIAVLMCVFSLILLFSWCFCNKNYKVSGSLFSYCLFFNFKECICSVCVILYS